MVEERVVSLHIAPDAHVPMKSIACAQVIPGRGIVGDRFYQRRGTDAAYDQATCDVTLVEQDAIEALTQQELLVDPGASAQRNIVVRDCSLAQLVGHTFRVGTVTLRGLPPHRPEDCSSERPERTRQHVSLEPLIEDSACVALPLRSHLRASILTEGVIYVGDQIELV